jgi:hypothetical protein
MSETLADPHPSPELLRRFASGELGGPEAEALEGHLETCAVCCQRLRELPLDPLLSRLQAAVSVRDSAESTGLTLRIQGTPFAYRPRPDQDVITLGRQYRLPGNSDDRGNDVVLRVPASETLSARISRRHLEIHRTPQGYVAVDHGKAGTLYNGQLMTPGVRQPLRSGDVLVVAGVIGLEVLLHDIPTVVLAPQQVEVPGAGSRTTPVVFEATVGDIVTVE